MGTNH
jgi:hypothetical protein